MPETWEDIAQQLKEYDPSYVTTGHVLNLLSKMDIPDNVWKAYAIDALQPGQMDLVERVNRARRQEDQYSVGDIVGIPAPNLEYRKRVHAINQALKAFPEADQSEFRQSLMSEAQESRDPWYEYLRKGGSRLGLDMLFSLWNIIPGLGVAKGGAKAAQGLSKAGKAAEGMTGWSAGRGFVGGSLPGSRFIDPVLHADVGKYLPWLERAKKYTGKATEKLGEKWAASPMGKAVGGPMGGRFQPLESDIQTAMAHATGMKEAGLEKAGEAQKKMKALFKELGIKTPEAKEDYYRQIIQAIERPGEATGVDPRALGAMTPQRLHDLELAKQLQASGKPYGREMSLSRDILQDPNMPRGYYPLMLGHEGREFFRKGTGIPGVEASALKDEPHRTLQRLVDPEALARRQLIDIGEETIGKLSDPRTGVTKRIVEGEPKFFKEMPWIEKDIGVGAPKMIGPSSGADIKKFDESLTAYAPDEATGRLNEYSLSRAAEGRGDSYIRDYLKERGVDVTRPLYEANRFKVHSEGKGIGRKLQEDINRLADEQGLTIWGTVTPSGKLDREGLTAFYKRLGFKEVEPGLMVRQPQKMREVTPIPASLQEATEAFPHLKGKFIEKPVEAYALHSQKTAQKIGMFNVLEAMKNRTIKVKKTEIGPGGQQIMKEVDSPLLVPVGPNMPEGFRPLTVKGLEGWATHGVSANRFENLYHGAMDPSAMIGALDASMKIMEKAPAGIALARYRKAWARNVLALHPGFWTANIATDLSLAYMSGVNNLPMRLGESIAVFKGVKRPIIKGVPNKALEKLARDYRVIGSSWAESMQYGDLAREIEPRVARQLRQWSEMTGNRLDRAIGRGIEKAGYGWEDLNNWAFKQGSKSSDTIRMAVFIDQLKKAQKAGNVIDDTVIARAAQYTKEALIDYGDLSSFTQSLKNIDPFISWYQGVIKRTLKDVIKKPERLNRASKFFDFLLEPMDPDSMEAAPEYVKQMNPVTGILGQGFGGEKNPLYWGLSRFMPWGTIEQLYRDPVGESWETIHPLLKTAIGLGTNVNTFFGGAVDPQATSSMGGIVNPILDPSGEFRQWSVAYRKPFGLNMPASWDYALSNLLPQARTLKEIETLGRAFSKAAGYPIWEDPGAPALTPEQAAFWFAGGGKLHEFDKLKGLATQYYDMKDRISRATQQKNQAIHKGDVELQKRATIQEYALKQKLKEFTDKYGTEIESYKEQLKERKSQRKEADAAVGEDYYRRYKRSQLTGTPIERLPERRFEEPTIKEPTTADIIKRYLDKSGYTPEEIKQLDMTPDELIRFLNVPRGVFPKKKLKKTTAKKPTVAQIIQKHAKQKGWTKEELKTLDYSTEELIKMLKIPNAELKGARKKKKQNTSSYLRGLGLTKEQAEEFEAKLR